MKEFSVLLLDADQELMGHKILRCLGSVPGVTVHIASNNKWAKCCFSRYASSVTLIRHSYRDDENLEQIRMAAEQVRPDIILPIHEPTIQLLSVHRKELEGLAALAPLPDPNDFATAVDKGKLAFLMQDLGIPCPLTLDCGDSLPSASEINDLHYPLMLKGRFGMGGDTVRKVTSFDQLETEFRRLQSDGNRCILQEYIEGYDICCNVLAHRGEIKAHTIQKGVVNERKAFSYSLVYEFVEDEQVLDNARRLIKALNWTGVCHIDMRMDPKTNTPKVFEINARFWGSTLGSLMAGVNFPYLACLQGLGIPFSTPASHSAFYYTRGLFGKPFKKEVREGIRGGIPYALHRTNFAFVSRDPLPEIVEGLRAPLVLAKKGLIRLLGPERAVSMKRQVSQLLFNKKS